MFKDTACKEIIHLWVIAKLAICGHPAIFASFFIHLPLANSGLWQGKPRDSSATPTPPGIDSSWSRRQAIHQPPSWDRGQGPGPRSVSPSWHLSQNRLNSCAQSCWRKHVLDLSISLIRALAVASGSKFPPPICTPRPLPNWCLRVSVPTTFSTRLPETDLWLEGR